MMKKAIWIIAPLFFLVGFWLLVNDSYQIRYSIKYQIFYRDYLAWKQSGGSMKPEYNLPLKLDPYRDSMVEGLTYEQIRKKFPFLIDGAIYTEPKSYKGTYQNFVRENDAKAQFLWFVPEDTFDWCVQIEKEKPCLVLVKG